MRWRLCAAVLAVLALCATTRASADAASNTTQAQCTCLQTWQSPVDGSDQQGCQNPNADPDGAWCAVDAVSCPGFFGVLPGFMGDSIHFDYCGAVRERTRAGCLCQSVWALPGSKKYKARCAHPNSLTERVCVANPETCPGSISEPQVQACNPATADENSTATVTARNCSCAAGWTWTYKQGGQQEFAGCANPDGDPLGAWCQVDAMTCEHFAGQVNASSKVINFDYCTAVETPVSAPGTCLAEVAHYQQCGGKSNCTDWGCSDAPWEGACCARADPELVCTRQNQFYHQCLNSIDIEMLKNGSASFRPPDSFVIVDTPASESGPSDSSNLSPSSTQLPSPDAMISPSPATTTVKLPGTQALLTLRIDYDYAKLAAEDAMAKFKEALVAWLTSIAGPAQYIYAISVTKVYAGSVVAEASIVFAANTPTSIVDATVARLKSTGADSYGSSGLSSTYGSLVSFMMSTGPSVGNDPGSMGATSAGGSIGTGVIAGIVIACITVVAGAGFAVSRALNVRVAGDQDKDAQLAYMNEMSEGEIAAEMAAAGKLRQEELKLGPADFTPNGRSSSWLNEWLGELPKPNPNQVAGHPSLAQASFSIRTAPTRSAQQADLSQFSGNPPEYGSVDSNSRMDVSDLAGGTPRSHITAEPSPDPAFLPLPDGETATKGGAGIAFASLKHRRISNGSQPVSPAASAAAAPGREMGVQSAISGLGTLSRLSSVVSNYMSGGGASAQEEKNH